MSTPPTYEELLQKIEDLSNENRTLTAEKEALRYRMGFDNLIMDISSSFINLPTDQVDTGINQALAAIGEFVDVDRVFVFIYHHNAQVMDNTHEWCQKDFSPQIAYHQNIPFESATWLIDQINTGKTVYIPVSDELPDEAKLLRRDNKRQGVKCSLVVPIEYGGTVIGFLGLNSNTETKAWSADIIGLLRVVGQIFANAMERKRSEEAVKASEEKYRTILETMHDGYWEVNLNGDFTFVNPAMCRIAERSYEELIGMPGSGDTDPETTKRIAALFTRIYETGKTEKLTDFEAVTPKGNRKVIEISVSLMKDKNGNPVGFKGVSRDVTERALAQQALKASEERYRTIIENVEDGYWEVDLDGNFTFVSSGMSKIMDRSCDALIGTSSLVGASKETARKMRQTFMQMYRTGKSAKLTVFEIVSVKGNTRNVEMSASLIRDENGNGIGYRGVSRDVTERYRAQQALQESEEKYRTVLEANPDPVVVTNLDGTVSYLNPAFEHIFGWSLKEVQGKMIRGFFPSGKRAEIRNMLERLSRSESLSGLDTHRKTKNGDAIPVSISGAVYRDSKGNALGAIFTFQDIREKKRMEAQLMNAYKFESIGTLAGGIAHDFNNLLMGIQGNVSLMLFDVVPDHPHYEHLKNIEKNIKSGSRLTSQLLGYARKGRYEVKPLELNRLVKDISDTFARTRKEIVVRHELADNLTPIEADEGQIEQVFLNILVNAGHAMPRGGNIFIKTENVTHAHIRHADFQAKPGRYVMVKVTDNGMGMDEKTRDHIFEPFFTTKEMGRGTGLGLASSYGIIKGHKGYITVASIPGEGTDFCVYLPATGKKVLEKTAVMEAVLSGKETILFVDDEDIVLNVGARIMEKLGYKVIKADGAKKAVAVYEERYQDIQMVILDIIMPEMSGSEVYDRIKEINPDAKVLLSSGYSIDGEARTILEKGCNGFIQKPFTVGELSEKIRRTMDG